MENIDSLCKRYPNLITCRNDITSAADMIIETYKNGGVLYTCGNGGSASDSDHIVGELMKGFLKKRPISSADREKLERLFPGEADFLADNLQIGLPALSLHSQSSLITAFANDVDASMMYAQVLYVLAKKGDALLAISTSGNSKNVVNAAKIAKMMDVKIISLTGKNNSILSEISDITIKVGESETYRVQELHLPVYHYICAAVENKFFIE